MAVESVDQQPRSNVPHGNGFVRRRAQKGVVELGEHHVVHTVDVPPESVPDLARGHVIESARVVHVSRDQEVAVVVEVDAPDGLGVVLEGMQTRHRQEVPDFDGSVARRGGQVGALGIETDIGDPLGMALATHDQFSVRNGPDFPGHVIGCSCKEGLLFVEVDSRNALVVGLVCLESGID